VEKSIMYIESGFSSVGLIFESTEGFVKHLIETQNALKAQGYKMLLKLKPNQVNSKLIEQGLAETKIELTTNEMFLQTLVRCEACIVETTSLAMLPAVFGMPMLLGNYGKLESLSFGPALASYPRAYSLKCISEVSAILNRDLQDIHSDNLRNWSELNIGPLPFEKMPERVVNILDDMMADAHQY
jgi:hypothetical protein